MSAGRGHKSSCLRFSATSLCITGGSYRERRADCGDDHTHDAQRDQDSEAPVGPLLLSQLLLG